MCRACSQSLAILDSFLRDFLNVEARIESHFVYKTDSSLEQALIKTEEVEIKSEENEAERDTQSPDPDAGTVDGVKCNSSDLEPPTKDVIQRRTLVHTDRPNTPMYECETCGFQTKYRKYLRVHQVLKHGDTSKTNAYKCEMCDHVAVWKSRLLRHMLTHKAATNTNMYRCSKCDFTTKYKCSLKPHELLHKESPIVYKCDYCRYETLAKHSLTRHLKIHPEMEEYKSQYTKKRKGRGRIDSLHHERLTQHINGDAAGPDSVISPDKV